MKKLVFAALALVLTFSMTVPAFAAEGSQTITKADTTSVDVNAKLDYNVDQPKDVISVDVKWTDMTFTYTQKQDKVWDPVNHKYDYVDKDAGSGWDHTDATVSVTNHSNVKIDAALTYAAEQNSNVTGTLSNPSMTLNSAEGTTVQNAPTASSTFTISGKPTVQGTAKVGTLTVAISKATD